ncbi:MAG: polysaccharide deacetylase family protein [Lachnospiraceae bacterium]
MPFLTLVYHEIRETKDLTDPRPSPIHVAQDYNDLLPPTLFVTLESFVEQMAWLDQAQYHTLTLTEARNHLLHGTAIPEKSVLLTFDDCYQSMMTYACPILRSHNFKAAAFVVGGWLNEARSPFSAKESICLSETDLLEIMDIFEYANHSYHLHTRRRPKECALLTSDEQTVSEDLQLCSQIPLLTHGDIFAYPFGQYSDPVKELLKEQGIRLAFTTVAGYNSLQCDPLLLHRNVVPLGMTLRQFQTMFTEIIF